MRAGVIAKPQECKVDRSQVSTGVRVHEDVKRRRFSHEKVVVSVLLLQKEKTRQLRMHVC
jgi:hypothetical protein